MYKYDVVMIIYIRIKWINFMFILNVLNYIYIIFCISIIRYVKVRIKYRISRVDKF